MKSLSNSKGITLIALVITIIVLLILAGISIATLTGQNGILTQANDAKQKTTQAKAEELVSLAIGALQTENLGDTSKITPDTIANKVNQDNNRTDVTAEGNTFPTNIDFADDEVKVWVDVDLSVGEGKDEPDYSVEVDEKEIAPAGLFKIEIVENEQASTNNIATTGYAKILGIKEEYCNKGGYEAEDGTTHEDTNYGINYNENGFEIKDKLIIPAYIEQDGVKYPVKEVSLIIKPTADEYGDSDEAHNIPNINTIIYPNTVTKIISADQYYIDQENMCKEVVLSKNIIEIPDNMFNNCDNIASISIPSKVTRIGNRAFESCRSLADITIPNSVMSIGDGAFYECDELKNIILPSNLTYLGNNVFAYSKLTSIILPSSLNRIEDYTFSNCISLTDVVIPSSITNIGEEAFSYCYGLTEITIPSSVTTIGDDAFKRCNYLTEINIEGKNEGEISGEPWGVDNATINWLGK